tara:strand:- start:396 stop:653 length:258 start_codon:yes stop_codon:yes gene_type:complete
MSKKKSYMDKNNIMTEGAIGDFLRGLFYGKSRLQKKSKRLNKALDKTIDQFNKGAERLEKAIEKQYGKKVKLPRQSKEDMIRNSR